MARLEEICTGTYGPALMKMVIAILAALLFALAPAAARGVSCDHAMAAAADADPHSAHGANHAGAPVAGELGEHAGPGGVCLDACPGGTGCAGCYAPAPAALGPAGVLSRFAAIAATVVPTVDAPSGRRPVVDPPPPRA